MVPWSPVGNKYTLTLFTSTPFLTKSLPYKVVRDRKAEMKSSGYTMKSFFWVSLVKHWDSNTLFNLKISIYLGKV